MVELIVTIFAGLGFCASVHFVIGLIGKVYNKIKEKKYYYWNVYYISRFERDIIFISTPTKDLKPEYIKDIIRK